MALEIREIVIRAIAGGEHNNEDKKVKTGESCTENKEAMSQQETLDMVSEIMKNDKER